MRTCEVCLQSQPDTNFREAPSNKEGYSKWCRSCINDYASMKGKQYRKGHIRKAKCEYSAPVGGYRPKKIDPKPYKTKAKVPANWNPSGELLFSEIAYPYPPTLGGWGGVIPVFKRDGQNLIPLPPKISSQ